MFQGLRTAIYHVDDLDKAKAWYSAVLGKQPYFDQPFYVGFNVGEGIRVATVLDPFGNVFGIIENPHFKIEN
jgi:catechol 2,3-dioxygenase-like lactoylglutathione lyase family enzyme